ncbi:E2-like conjugating enzyme atg10 [Fusarium torreyae]|uniref:Ubiquitin-like-conjugating enzyme ATG10 n=1 Tax=Fusarium torreyae TaxID=1237075 RepID=A0A9W8VQK0_9HYPO|nr:E2-like conjugating enzyme atg10 [Fusarium torreyae]
MSIENFPSLSPEEFTEACHHLDRQYCQASLGPQRARWKLRLCNALCTDFAFGGGFTTYIQIRRPLEFDLDHGDLSLDLDGFAFSDEKSHDVSLSGDKDMLDAEEADEAALIRQRARPEVAMVEYEIHLHPTYRVPCLWFTLRNLPADEPAFNVDTVFRRLVPDEYKAGLRALGTVGGISADHHPVTGVPSFFVHPCLLGDAISKFECDRTNYLMIWLGLVGGCVGLWVPKEMAMQ